MGGTDSFANRPRMRRNEKEEEKDRALITLPVLWTTLRPLSEIIQQSNESFRNTCQHALDIAECQGEVLQILIMELGDKSATGAVRQEWSAVECGNIRLCEQENALFWRRDFSDKVLFNLYLIFRGGFRGK